MLSLHLAEPIEIQSQFDAVYMQYLNEGKQELSKKESTEFVMSVLSQIVEDNRRE